jgi:hypothetical protein
MSKIISERHEDVLIEYWHEFEYPDKPGCGFCFDCDADGKPILTNDDARRNYEECITGKNRTINKGIRKIVRRFMEPAVLECDCGEHIRLQDFTNTCDNCGADYNLFGQLLAPREQWGCETGEHPSECY